MAYPKKDLVEAIKVKEAQLRAVVSKRHPTKLAPVITILYNLDSSRALGTYQFMPVKSEHVIRLNPKLLNELGKAYIDDVFVHEYAHACVQHYVGYYNGRKRVMPHGMEFKSFCRMFGIDGKATTSVAANAVTMKKPNTANRHTYTCECHEFHLSTQRHNKILRGATYTCKKCGGKLKKK